MILIEPFRTFSLLNFCGINQLQEMMVTTKHNAKCAHPLKARKIVGSKARFLYKHVGNKKAKTTHPRWQRAQFTIVRMMCIKKMNHCMLPA
jgi:hypothetical protein